MAAASARLRLRLATLRYQPQQRARMGRPMLTRRSTPGTHTVTAWDPYGYSLEHIRLQPGRHTVTAWDNYGCSLGRLRLQPGMPTVAAPAIHSGSSTRAKAQPAMAALKTLAKEMAIESWSGRWSM